MFYKKEKKGALILKNGLTTQGLTNHALTQKLRIGSVDFMNIEWKRHITILGILESDSIKREEMKRKEKKSQENKGRIKNDPEQKKAYQRHGQYLK